ncbi:MAG: N-acetylneuraminate synthase family protein [Myxococcaceae bacterium]|nr:N-acetylneuraminate synthase family protein [Myxococcaceae bacterium]
MKLGAREVGAGQPCLVVAEVAQAHDGSLGAAHADVDAAAKAGADAIKFQTHIASAESTPGEQFRVKFSKQDANRYDYWKRMEFTEAQWHGLKAHCDEKGLLFLSSPFSMQAVELLGRVGVPAWKVGAGEVSNLPMLQALRKTGLPVILSSGMSPYAELDAAVEAVGRNCAVLQCTTSYPCPPERLGLNVLGELRQRYPGMPVGLSDHSGTIFAGLAAAALGCDVLELHMVFSKECFGPDTSSSVTTPELAQLVQGIRFIEKARANPVNKDAAAESMGELRRLFGKSVVVGRALPAGHRLTEVDLAVKKPGTGIPAARLAEVVGRTLKRAVSQDTLLSEDDLG